MSEATATYAELGGSILLRSDPDGPAILEVDGVVRSRFMDRLYLPTATDCLSVEQIQVINRFREAEIGAGPGFAYRERLRDLVKAVVSAVGEGGLLEIGCGKFPLSAEVPLKVYHGIEIDDEAIEFNRARGILCSRDVAVESAILQECDLCVALFAFHFHVSDATLDLMTSGLSAQALIIFNVVSKRPQIRTRVALDLLARGLWVAALDLASEGVNDTLYFASRADGIDRALAAKRVAETFVASSSG